jgi:hypothetical protein
MTYLIPNGTLLNFTLTCSEFEDGLYYKVIRDQALFSSIRIENYQYFRIAIKYKGPDLVMNQTKLYLLYKGNNVLFTGDDITFDSFTSLGLPFGNFYKT